MNDRQRRLLALEAKKPAHPPVRHIFIMPADWADADVSGFAHGEQVIRRQPGETLDALQDRAAESVAGAGVAILGALGD